MDISTVVPIYNNESTIEELYKGLTDVFENIGKSYELIFVNDGSVDNSWKIISAFQKKDPHIKAIDFRRNYGQSAALQAGFDISKGMSVLTIGASLENDPADLSDLYDALIKKDNDMVIGVRSQRYDGRLFSRIRSSLAHSVLKFVSKNSFADVTSPVRAFEREVIDNIKLFGDAYMYLPVLATLYGAKFEEIKIKHTKPKDLSYIAPKTSLFKFIFDIIFLKFFVSATTPPFHMAPIRLFGGLGSISAFLGLAGGAFLTYQKIAFGQDIGTRPLLMLSILLLILGAMFLVFGILGEIIIRTYFEGQNKLIYTTRERLVA
ncbi:hypothetical protein CO058_02675 [candidate division WWE3 bacterium CG_4_9_14_0_2_um_filter_35_11]|uniref:Glycosyltransferase 2-like domain-containing protein n=1 Tax=candidate division WWE3 bacterium CG_4_9_14_0_2_um_filter_35_11 TaxID=1975077 RepID=A0A2M8ELM1_UNCKA|nr:MAG: hypothetical protein COV25_02935 [candidate division WWE3 bacterium CG10_big_fil_rev_8_21_14_0_10_35_32]PJC23639.1 MAG: hypothetical protein CO058_02675 [candidate division WWE3 bacterium CG_4_9_14_0_2_um_filter_35_11]